MNYFELFQIPVQLKVNTALLSKKFFELSRTYHPDYFTNEDAAAQEDSLEKSSILNAAWKTFQNQDDTIKYVLQLKGVLEEDEKYQLPADFLLEVMEINESLMDDSGEEESLILKSRIDTLQAEIYKPVKNIIEEYQNETATPDQLKTVKEYYYKKKYLDRISRELTGMA